MGSKKKASKKKRNGVIRSRIVCFLIFVIIALIATIAYFKFSNPKQQTAQVRVRISTDSSVILDYPITVVGADLKASMAIEKACAQKNIPYTFENGFFDNFAGIGRSAKEAWVFYKNEVLSPTGVTECPIAENDFIEFRFENSNAAYISPENQPSQEDMVAVKLKFSSSDKILLESSVSVEKDMADVLTATKSLCDSQKLSYTIEDGSLVSFKDNSNSETEKWQAYINGNLIEDELEKCEIADGDVVDFKFEEVE